MPIETFAMPDHYDEPDISDADCPMLLKACPICEGRAERVDIEEEGDNFGGSCIQCTKCGLSTAVHFDRKENLYGSWNDRASDHWETVRAILSTWDTPSGMTLEALATAIKARIEELERANENNKIRIEQLLLELEGNPEWEDDHL